MRHIEGVYANAEACVIDLPAACSVAGSIEDIFLSCSEPKRNVVEPSLVSVGTATMIHRRRCCWWWCVQDVRLKIAMHRCDVWTCMSAANASALEYTILAFLRMLCS